ncbi:hypothetical protein SH668x_002355 [Planctomicrobium sp. SH668]|uniref:hypothetical protein n=1 Tax=Planctomicrobium sp. SH668 TaxID=3448126 RepID=UPI003F5BEEE6
MKHDRLRIEIDIVAQDREHAEALSRILYALIERRSWIKVILPDGMQERQPIDNKRP